MFSVVGCRVSGRCVCGHFAGDCIAMFSCVFFILVIIDHGFVR